MESILELRKALFVNGIYAENEIVLLRQIQSTDKEAYLDIYKEKSEWKILFAIPEIEAGERLWEGFNDSGVIYVVIIRKSDGAFCGFCGLQELSEFKLPELSIEIVKECRKQGIGALAISMLMSRFADVTGRRSFISKVESENIASQMLMRKLGGKADGVAPFPGFSKETLEILEKDDSPQSEDIDALAKEFGTTPRCLRSHVLVFRIELKY